MPVFRLAQSRRRKVNGLAAAMAWLCHEILGRNSFLPWQCHAQKCMRIVEVIPSLASRNGGPSFFVVDLASALKTLGHEVTIVTTDSANPAQAHRTLSGATLDDFPAGASQLSIHLSPLAWPQRWAYSPELARAVNREIPLADIVHIHSVNLHTQYAAWRASRRHNRPYIFSPHGALDPYILQRNAQIKRINDALWQRKMIEQAKIIHVTSAAEREFMNSYKPPVRVIPIGVNAAFLNASQRASRPESPVKDNSTPVLVNHGRLTKKKGLDLLVRALPLFSNPLLRLVLIGPDDEGIGAELEALAHDLGVSNRLEILEQLHGGELLSVLAQGDIWILPSHSENYGMAVTEAMALGLPVITSPHVNVAAEAVREGALVITPNDPKQIASAVDRLLEDSHKRQLLAERGKAFAERHSWEAIAQKFIELYISAAEA